MKDRAITTLIQTIVAERMLKHEWLKNHNVKMKVSETLRFADTCSAQAQMYKQQGYTPVAIKSGRYTFKVKIAIFSTEEMRRFSKCVAEVVPSVIPVGSRYADFEDLNEQRGTIVPEIMNLEFCHEALPISR